MCLKVCTLGDAKLRRVDHPLSTRTQRQGNVKAARFRMRLEPLVCFPVVVGYHRPY